MLKRLCAIAAGLAALLVACGIPDNGQVSSIQSKDLRNLGDTIPSTSTSTTTAPTVEPSTTTTALDTATTIATVDVTLYFVSGGQLKGYPRGLARPATINSVLSALQEGPPAGDVGTGIRSALPKKEKALIKSASDDGSGIATIELPAGFFEQIPQEDQLFAIGQIVLTVLDDVPGVGQVLFTQSGLPLPVPRREGGGLTDGITPLARRDYAELLNPTPTTTTIIATTTVATTIA